MQANVQDRDLGGFVNDVEAAIQKMDWGNMTYQMTGEYENQRRFTQTMQIVFPAVMLIIFVMLYMVYHSAAGGGACVAGRAVRFERRRVSAKAAGLQFQWRGVGGLHRAVRHGGANRRGDGRLSGGDGEKAHGRTRRAFNAADLVQAVKDGARLRLRPKVMTVATIVASLLPIMWSHRQGAEVMKPLATPVIGGMLSSLIHILIVTPVIFCWLRERELRKKKAT